MRTATLVAVLLVGQFDGHQMKKPLISDEINGLSLAFGGERGIRTPDRRLTYTRFPGVRLKPLIHLSSKNESIANSARPPPAPSAARHAAGRGCAAGTASICLHIPVAVFAVWPPSARQPGRPATSAAPSSAGGPPGRCPGTRPGRPNERRRAGGVSRRVAIKIYGAIRIRVNRSRYWPYRRFNISAWPSSTTPSRLPSRSKPKPPWTC